MKPVMGFSGSEDDNKNVCEFVDTSFSAFVDSFTDEGAKTVAGDYGVADWSEADLTSHFSKGLANFLRGRPRELEKASSQWATSTISAATKDDGSSDTTENSSLTNGEEFEKRGRACGWRNSFISESTSPSPPKRLRSAHTRLDVCEGIKQIQARLNDQPIVKGLVVPASKFSATEEEALVKDTLYSPPSE